MERPLGPHRQQQRVAQHPTGIFIVAEAGTPLLHRPGPVPERVRKVRVGIWIGSAKRPQRMLRCGEVAGFVQRHDPCRPRRRVERRRVAEASLASRKRWRCCGGSRGSAGHLRPGCFPSLGAEFAEGRPGVGRRRRIALGRLGSRRGVADGCFACWGGIAGGCLGFWGGRAGGCVGVYRRWRSAGEWRGHCPLHRRTVGNGDAITGGSPGASARGA